MYRAFFVDDEPLVLEAFMSQPVFLESGVISIGHCTNPLVAVDAIAEANPDVVFTDLKMPGLNGIEMMNKLKEKGYSGEFVIISAYGEFEEVRRFFTMDGFDYLIKPVSEQDLQTLLEKLDRKLTTYKKVAASLEETPSPELNKVTDYIRRYIAKKHTLETIGALFNLKPNYICNLFSRYLGTTFVTYVKNTRMEAAAMLLATSQIPVKEIAIICGYSDYFYFCRVFKDMYAITPTAYRKAAK